MSSPVRPALALRCPAKVVATAAVALVTALGVSACTMGSATVSSTMTAATAAPTSAGASATIPTASATLAGSGAATDAALQISGEAVPGSEYAADLTAKIKDAKTVTASFVSSAGSGSAKIDTSKHNLQLDVTGGAGPVSLLRIGGQTWVKGAGAVDGKPWLLLDPSGADAISTKLGDVDALVNRVDPAAFPRLFTDTVGDKTPGPDGGTKIAWRIGAAQFLDVMGASAQQRSSITKPVDIALALDAVGLPTSLDVAYAVAGQVVNDRTTFRSWGVPVTLAAPAAAQVAPAPGSLGTPTPTAPPTATSTRSATATGSATRTGTTTPKPRATSTATRTARATATSTP